MHIQPLKIALTGLLLAATTSAEWRVIVYSSSDCSGDSLPTAYGGGSDSDGCEAIIAGANSAMIYQRGDGGPYDVQLWTTSGCEGDPDGRGTTSTDPSCVNAGDGATWACLKVAE